MQVRPIAYEGEYGFSFEIHTDFDATGVSTAVFRFKAPDGTRTDKTATAVTTAADGDFAYTVEEGFFVKGEWSVQMILTFPSSVSKSEPLWFTVGPEISAS